jgi:hypothetical protein
MSTEATTDVETKLKPYVVRLEWASMIAYVDVAVMAKDPEAACQQAFEDVDYDKQDNYNDGGETYVGGIVEQKTIEHANQTCADRAMWDYMPGPDVPLKHQSEDQKSFAYEKIICAMLVALKETVGCYAAGDVADEPPFVETLRAAITQAEAAGIKVQS